MIKHMPVKLLLVCLCAVLMAGCQSSKKDSDESQLKRAKLHYQIGIDALHKNQLPKAFEELMVSEKIDPKQPEVLDALAYAWRLRGDLKKSETYYKKALRFGAGAATHNNYGNLLLEMKRYKDAKVQLTRALEDPRYRNQFIAYINLGDAELGLQQIDEAIKAYRKAGVFKPNQLLPRIREARAYVADNRLNYALALYETILREQPSNREVLEGLLEVLKMQKDYHSARKHLATFMEQASISKLDRAWAKDALVNLSR